MLLSLRALRFLVGVPWTAIYVRIRSRIRIRIRIRTRIRTRTRVMTYAATCAALFAAWILSSPAAQATITVPTDALYGGLLDEPLSQSRDPHFFDWWRGHWDLEAGYGAVNESNDFRSEFFEVGALIQAFDSFGVRVAYRHVAVWGTSSSDLIALTPFTQAAQGNRHEFFLGADYPFLAGRSFSRLSPWLGDLEHSLSLVAGLHDSIYYGDPLPGQREIKYQLVAEAGLRFKFGLPHSLALNLQWEYQRPVVNPDPDLESWTTWMGGLSWTFGN